MKKESLLKILEVMELHETIKILKKSVETCLGFHAVPMSEDELAIGTSKVGGNPDLPSSFQWPTWNNSCLDFLLQLNLAEVPEPLRNDLLPTAGWLYFFYDRKGCTWGFDPQDRGSWRVFFFQGHKDTFVRTKRPGTFGHDTLKACGVEFYEAFCPDWPLVRNHPELKNHPEEISKLDNLIESIPRFSLHQIMGTPDGIQSSSQAMQRRCQFVSHGIYMGGSGGPPFDEAKAKKLNPGAKDWRLLLQLDSDSGPGMRWGDRGRLYFWIREQDLREKNFEDVWMILECL